jgi:hypothetical protein
LNEEQENKISSFPVPDLVNLHPRRGLEPEVLFRA